MPRKQLGRAAAAANDLMTRADVLALAGRHAKFTGSTSTAFAINLGQTQTMTVTVTPVVAGDSLLAGEDVNVQPAGPLPNGVNIAYAYVSDTNKVVIAFTSSGLISVSQTVAWRVTAFR